MNKKYGFLLCLVFSTVILNAQKAKDFNGCRFTIDLNHVYQDRLKVILKNPPISTKSITYHLPKIVPGMYSIDDYGRYVEQFKAFDKNGDTLPVKRKDPNSWTIFQANRLSGLSYLVNDSFDDSLTDQVIFEPGGSDIQKDTVFVLNNHCFLGYFDNRTNIPYMLTVIHPAIMYGSTAMTDTDPSATVDRFVTTSYNQIVDNPILYDIPDTSFIRVGNSSVLISVYSQNKRTSSGFISRNLDTLLKDQAKYLGGKLPVDKYAFLIFQSDKPSLSGSTGALEHSFSSFYFLGKGDSVQLAGELEDDAAHEFFHIITPLSIHSDKIQHFDFTDPRMSEHLWLYEGSTEYHANMVQEKYGIISPAELLNRFSGMITISRTSFNDTVPMTVMSSGVLGSYKDQFSNVYEKGALVVMCLDIKLLQLSNGKYGFVNLMKDLSLRYGINKAFKDEELFDVIGKLTYPEITAFLRTYVSGSQPLPLDSVFKIVGVNFQPVLKTRDSLFTIGGFKRKFDPVTQRYRVTDISEMDAMGKALGFHRDDEIISVNGVDFTPMPLVQFIEKFQLSSGEGKELVVKVARKNEKGEDQILELKAMQFKCPVMKYNVLDFSDSAAPNELMLRNSWLKPNGIQVN